MTNNELTITLPSLGEHVEEATITRWLVRPGDTVDTETPLVEVATDKVDTEVPSPQAGIVITVHAEEDEVVQIGAPLITISTQIDAASSPDSPADPPDAADAGTTGNVETQVETASSPDSPAVAADAGDAGNVENAVEEPVPANPTVAVGDGGSATAADPNVTVERLPRIRQTIAKRMLASLQSSAQLTTVVEADVTNISNLRAAHKSQFLRATGTKLSFLPFFAKALTEALGEHRVLGAFVNAEATEITYHHNVHLGIAVDGPKGLMVPVIRDAERLGIPELARQIADLAEQVRAGTIRPDDLTGGTFTITNTGSRGALFDTPILNQPQSGILGTGSVVDRVVAVRDAYGAASIHVRPMVYLALSYDHRIVDGADAARFLGTVKNRLEAGFTERELFEGVAAAAAAED